MNPEQFEKVLYLYAKRFGKYADLNTVTAGPALQRRIADALLKAINAGKPLTAAEEAKLTPNPPRGVLF